MSSLPRSVAKGFFEGLREAGFEAFDEVHAFVEDGENERWLVGSDRVENVMMLAAGVEEVFALGNWVAWDDFAIDDLFEASFELSFVFLGLFYVLGFDRVACNGAEIFRCLVRELIEVGGHYA